MQELKFEELSIKQKLGMVMAGILRMIEPNEVYGTYEENFEFVLDQIRNHALGAVWIPQSSSVRDAALQRINEVADYPILIITDAENGLKDRLIGRHNAIGMANSEELAYTFGKVTAITARQMGYNVICDPLLDMPKQWGACGKNCRALGSNKETVTKLALAEARGIHDAGVLTVAKHYPGGNSAECIDSHMAEACADQTREELLEENLYPYLALMKEGLLDGIMTEHKRFPRIDEKYPASLSKKVIDIIREQGFEGFAITDALDMMGIKAKFGDTRAKGMCIEAGNEFILPWFSAKKAYRDLCDCYEEGLISDARLDVAVKRILTAQHKVMVMQQNAKFDEVTPEDLEAFERINTDSIYARTDAGVPVAIDPNGKHFFAVLVRNETDVSADGKVSVDTFTNGWHFPARIQKKLLENFPNSTVRAIRQFPTPAENQAILHASLGYEQVIFLTFAEAPAYAGSDALTQRITALIKAMQITSRISTVMHFGNPYVLEDIAHVSRVLIGPMAANSIDAGIEVLAGKREAKGVLTYDVNFR